MKILNGEIGENDTADIIVANGQLDVEKNKRKKTMDIYKQAKTVAETFDVSSPENSVVLYSISYLPTTRNRDLAFDCVRSNPGKMMIEHTACGAELVRLGLDSADKCNLPSEQIAAVWKAASKRFIEAASGNVCAFVEKADRRSVFRSMELPTILQNERIRTVNGTDKYEFAKIFSD